MALRLIGYWKTRLGDEYPFPQELRASADPALRDRVVAHLRSGAVVERYRGTSWCRFGCPEPNGSTELSDGTWRWPEGLAHYVAEHQVALPPDFVRDVVSAAGSTRPDSPDDVDDAAWIAWAREHRLPRVATLLDEARRAADDACEVTLSRVALELTRDLGVGDRACVGANCVQLALAGRALCGRCIAERDREAIASGAEVDELRRLNELLASE